MLAQDEPGGTAWWTTVLVDVDCIGVNERELAEIASDQDCVLPLAYSNFLRVAGRRCGSLWRGSDAFYPAILGLKRDAEELMRECGSPSGLHDSNVVIAMHQGYQFLFLAGDTLDPSVRRFSEQDGVAELVNEHFTSFMLSTISGV